MSRSLPCLLIAAAVTLATTAGAAPPSFDSIATGAFPAPPDPLAAPASIPATEKVEGLVLEHRPAALRDMRWQISMHVEGRRCLRRPTDWTDPIDRAPTAHAAMVSVHAGVLPVRQERLVRDDAGGAVLEISDVWIDPATLGARVSSTTRLQLTRLAQGPATFAVYGVRVGDAVHIVAPTERVGVSRDAGGRVGTAECGHVRVPLELGSGAAPAGGAMAHIAAFPEMPPPPIPRAEQAFERRPLAISASLSRVKRDPAPVLSVTVAWAPVGTGDMRGDLGSIEAE